MKATQDQQIAFDMNKARLNAQIQSRLWRIREAIKAESVSYSEIVELQSLVDFIEPGDTLLLEWAGVPENK